MTMQADVVADLAAGMSAEPECEYGHFGVAPCTGSVTHRLVGCTEGGVNVCTSAAAVVVERLSRDDCVDCGRSAADCWSMWRV